VLADGRQVSPQMVQGPCVPGARLAVVGDTEEVAALVEPVRGADALAIEATFLERDAALAHARGHLTAAMAAALARDAGVGQLLLTHISGRYRPEEIVAEAARLFPRTRVVADFERIAVGGDRRRQAPHHHAASTGAGFGNTMAPSVPGEPA
jgi:ribonuclease Z